MIFNPIPRNKNYFSFLTPLNGLLSDFISMNLPVVVFRFTQVSVLGLWV